MQFLVQNYQQKHLIKSSNRFWAHANLTSNLKIHLSDFGNATSCQRLVDVSKSTFFFFQEWCIRYTINYSMRYVTSSNPIVAVFTAMTRKGKGMGCTHQFVSKFLQTSWEVSKYTLSRKTHKISLWLWLLPFKSMFEYICKL